MIRLVAEFSEGAQLLAAVRKVQAAQLSVEIEAYSPCPVEGLAEALSTRREWLAEWMLGGGLVGGCATFAMEWYSAVYAYPVNVGGRPLLSWPAFVPPALEVTLLCAAGCGVVAWLMASGLPRFHHPLFALPEFDAASNNRFFLVVVPQGPHFDEERVRKFLRSLSPLSLSVTS
jgi:hypothetical protein